MRDALKANIGLLILVMMFTGMLTLAVYVFMHPGYTSASDFLVWVQGKIGEILASIMTIIVGAASKTDRRSSDTKVNGETTVTKTTIGNDHGTTVPNH